MKKRLLLFFLTFVSNCLLAQYKLYVFSDFYDAGYVSHREQETNLFSNNIRIKMNFSYYYNDDPSDDCGGPCGQEEDLCEGIEIDKVLNLFEELSLSYNPDDYSDDPRDLNISCLPLNYQAILLPILERPNETRCSTQNLFSQYSDGTDHYVNGVTWKYWTGTEYKPIPKYSNRVPLNVSLLDVFGNNWRNEFRGNLQLQLEISAPFTTKTYTENFTIDVNDCSPKFKGLTSYKTSCSYTSDASFKLKLGRKLENETLVVSLYTFDTNNKPYFVAQDVIRSLVSESDGTYSFIWKKPLDGNRKYFLKYQTKNGDVNSISKDDPSWDSLEPTNTFFIESVKPLTYNITSITDESCYQSGDGIIEVKAQGAENRTFYYQLNNGSWTPFEDSTYIRNLTKGSHKIMVKDSNDCYYKK